MSDSVTFYVSTYSMLNCEDTYINYPTKVIIHKLTYYEVIGFCWQLVGVEVVGEEFKVADE